MRTFFTSLRKIFSDLGLVEQSQVVASTAVIVSMGTVIAIYLVSGKKFEWYEFISIFGIGIIGFASVFFTLKYGRQLEEQRRELLALNTLADAVNHSMELRDVFRNALEKVTSLLHGEYGWIYTFDMNKFELSDVIGTTKPIIDDSFVLTPAILYILEENYKQNTNIDFNFLFPLKTKQLSIESVAATILRTQESIAGVLFVASTHPSAFANKQLELLVAFGNQISVAINNAQLFKRLRESERRYADLYEHSPDMYHLVNEEGIITDCNTTEATMLNYNKEEIIGKSVFSFFHPDDIDEARRHHYLQFKTEQGIRGIEARLLKKDGSSIVVSINSSTINNASGKPVMIRSVLRDITEKKKLEQQILQAQKIDSIGNLAGGIAHDFNNILSSILGPASMLKRKIGEKNKFFEYVEVMESAARRGAALARQLLTFARRSHFETHKIEIQSVLKETMTLFERSVDRRISIKSEFMNGTAIVMGDDGQLQQAFLNVLINARDAMPEGGVVTISTQQLVITDEHVEVKPGKYVEIRISDTGGGIEENILDQIFEPFFTTKEKGKGTGLGLSVAYGIIQTHKGTIIAESKKNHGAIFRIFLPLHAQQETLAPSRKRVRLQRGREHILLVDDEESVLRTTTAMLSDLGYKVKIAASGEEAIEQYEKNKPMLDLIILDMNLPKGSGEDVLKKIRSQHDKIKILISSGYADNILPTSTLEKLANGFLPKPYRIEDLAEKVRQALDS